VCLVFISTFFIAALVVDASTKTKFLAPALVLAKADLAKGNLSLKKLC
jgi:hypothetical protein